MKVFISIENNLWMDSQFETSFQSFVILSLHFWFGGFLWVGIYFVGKRADGFEVSLQCWFDLTCQQLIEIVFHWGYSPFFPIFLAIKYQISNVWNQNLRKVLIDLLHSLRSFSVEIDIYSIYRELFSFLFM